MDISKAIEILKLELAIPEPAFHQDKLAALKLGIEALKRELAERIMFSGDAVAPLPGETEGGYD